MPYPISGYNILINNVLICQVCSCRYISNFLKILIYLDAKIVPRHITALTYKQEGSLTSFTQHPKLNRERTNCLQVKLGRGWLVAGKLLHRFFCVNGLIFIYFTNIGGFMVLINCIAYLSIAAICWIPNIIGNCSAIMSIGKGIIESTAPILNSDLRNTGKGKNNKLCWGTHIMGPKREGTYIKPVARTIYFPFLHTNRYIARMDCRRIKLYSFIHFRFSTS